MKQIILRDAGILPGNDVTTELYELFRANPTDTEFVFEDGEYYFSPKLSFDYRLSNTEPIPERKLGIWLREMENVRLTGNGAKLLYSGKMQPITLDRCKNVTVEGFKIDWPKPLVAEGIVLEYTDDFIKMYVDPDLYPHRLGENKLEFDVGNGEWYAMTTWSQIQFDGERGTVRRGSGDHFVPTKVEPTMTANVYRFFAKNTDTAVGNIIVLRHNVRDHAGIFVEKCENVTLSDITVYSCGGLGGLVQFSRDVTFRRVHFLPNRELGRRVACGRDDGMHVTNCSGKITITECSFYGLMDDPINVHSCCVNGVEWLDETTLRCSFMHRQALNFHYWAEEGDELAFIDRKHMNKIHSVTVVSYSLETPETFVVKFAAPIPNEIRALEPSEVSLDDLTHTAEFECTNNRFGSGRARGVLVSTPKKVLIANNYFESSGSAILVAGDSNFWYESGECHDVEITGNVFTDACLSSMYQFCEGIISVCPVVPEPTLELPFHKNIRIHSNTFDTPGTPLLYAFATRGLEFRGNRIFASPGSVKWHPGRAFAKLEFCSNVRFENNLKVGEFELSGIETTTCEGVFGDI